MIIVQNYDLEAYFKFNAGNFYKHPVVIFCIIKHDPVENYAMTIAF